MTTAVIFIVGGIISIVAGIFIYKDIQKQQQLQNEEQNNKN